MPGESSLFTTPAAVKPIMGTSMLSDMISPPPVATPEELRRNLVLRLDEKLKEQREADNYADLCVDPIKITGDVLVPDAFEGGRSSQGLSLRPSRPTISVARIMSCPHCTSNAMTTPPTRCSICSCAQRGQHLLQIVQVPSCAVPNIDPDRVASHVPLERFVLKGPSDSASDLVGMDLDSDNEDDAPRRIHLRPKMSRDSSPMHSSNESESGGDIGSTINMDQAHFQGPTKMNLRLKMRSRDNSPPLNPESNSRFMEETDFVVKTQPTLSAHSKHTTSRRGMLCVPTASMFHSSPPRLPIMETPEYSRPTVQFPTTAMDSFSFDTPMSNEC